MNLDASPLRNKGWMKGPDLYRSAMAHGVLQLIDCLGVLVMLGPAWFWGPAELMEEPRDFESVLPPRLSEQGCAKSSGSLLILRGEQILPPQPQLCSSRSIFSLYFLFLFFF